MIYREDPIKKVLFRDLNLFDPFFDSLRESYSNLNQWFSNKVNSGDSCFVVYGENNRIHAMLYLKYENGRDETVIPCLIRPRLKIGTFKVSEEHHTGLGRRLLAVALREFACSGCPDVYVTLFSNNNTHSLFSLLISFGFEYHGKKPDGEIVLIKHRPTVLTGNAVRDFPFIDLNGSFYYLSILPEFHRRMFGETHLSSEEGLPVLDGRSINSVEKLYLSGSEDAKNLQQGDKLVIYRTSDKQGLAKYRSVVSGVCTVLSICHISNFESFDEFLSYIKGRSVFTDTELVNFWNSRKYPWIISMLYSVPFERYPNRNRLIKDDVLDCDDRIVITEMDMRAFCHILQLGSIDEGYVIN